jgi:hypothetical protein
MVVRKRH